MRRLRQASHATLLGPRPEAFVAVRGFFASSLSYPVHDSLRLIETVFASWLARALSICDATLDETRSGGVLNTSGCFNLSCCSIGLAKGTASGRVQSGATTLPIFQAHQMANNLLVSSASLTPLGIDRWTLLVAPSDTPGTWIPQAILAVLCRKSRSAGKPSISFLE